MPVLKSVETILSTYAQGFNTSCGTGKRSETRNSHKAILILSWILEKVPILFRKLSLDASQWAAGAWLKRGCRVSSSWCLCSFMLTTCLLISGGAISARIYRLSVGVGPRQCWSSSHVWTFTIRDMHTQQQSSRVLRQLILVFADWLPKWYQWVCPVCCSSWSSQCVS